MVIFESGLGISESGVENSSGEVDEELPHNIKPFVAVVVLVVGDILVVGEKPPFADVVVLFGEDNNFAGDEENLVAGEEKPS